MSLTTLVGAMPLWALGITFAVALLLIIKGGDIFVDAASFIAKVLKIPKLIIGATIVAFATTLPEMIVSISATAKGNVEIAAGNAIGSVTANTALVMGILLIGLPIAVDKKDFTPKGIILFLSAAVLILACIFTPRFSKTSLFSEGSYYSLSLIGIIVLAILCLSFFIQSIHHTRHGEALEAESFHATKKETVRHILLFIAGAAGIVIGAQLLVESGSEAAKRFGIDQRIISIVAFALGTSLPELVTAISAIRKKQSSISVGNIVGANIIDLTLILPLCALTSSISGNGSLAVPSKIVAIDMSVCLICIAIAVIPTMIRGKFKRSQGVLMLGFYLVYVCLTVVLG